MEKSRKSIEELKALFSELDNELRQAEKDMDEF